VVVRLVVRLVVVVGELHFVAEENPCHGAEETHIHVLQ